MAVTFEAIGWEDFDGHRHKGTPSDLDATHGVIIHYWDIDNPAIQDEFIVYARDPFQAWAEWWVFIGEHIIHNYGLDLAD